ncbi:cell wall-binding repeat-containing protein [Herbiconiux sp. CPCC 205763]|uniref:Cell wall-binding repeat-containing protein n=1 Tax=Herbiconiux aconitum TaxID=2970913 RepID=A0ABT2GSR9_9MICO|nr:cell wall-binding repeat-containing protein [Herbiconiux aconitum]MCS5717886.1 cell wall-binding repeat-containing protein [Herbiconiux aconitum]
MNEISQGRSARPARWLLALALGTVLTAAPMLASAPPANAAGPYVAVDDTYSTTQSAKFTSQLGVQANDSLGGEDLAWWAPLSSLPKHGQVLPLLEKGKFTYTPDAGFSGTDSFQYCLTKVFAECASNYATVTITVDAAVPVDDHLATPVGAPLLLSSALLLANDVNAAHVQLSASPRPTMHGVLAINPDLSVTYTPNAGFIGVDTLTYCLAELAHAACQTSSATVFINVGMPVTSRVSGADRYEVAVQIANGMFPTTAPVLFVASGVNYPDALSAGPAAAKLGGALLLTLPDRVPDNVAAKVSSLKPGRIVIIGGVNSVSEAVVGQLKTLVPGATLERVGGADRYEVSRAIADKMFGPFAHAQVTTGATFADALSAGAAAGAVGEPVVLVKGDAPAADAPTLALFATHNASALTIVGGVNSVSTAVEMSLQKVGPVNRIGGADRFEASYNLNHAAFTKADTVYLATGLNFPDALAGSVLAGSGKSPLYVIPKSCVPRVVIDDIVRLGAKKVVLLGGTDSLTDDVAKLIACKV